MSINLMLKYNKFFCSWSHYEILKLTQAATQDEIKKSFRDIVKSIHPDVRKNNKD
jgi:curved DNA-binding protein CbpA